MPSRIEDQYPHSVSRIRGCLRGASIFHFVVILAALLGTRSSLAQTAPADLKDEASVARYAEGICVQALDFKQGDSGSLMDAQDNFAPDGWLEFMKAFDGSLDDRGAPKFSSNFSPSGKALDIHRDNGTLTLTIPGILKQEVRNKFGGISTTTYRAEIEIQLGGTPVKIERLKQRICGGAKTVTSCR